MKGFIKKGAVFIVAGMLLTGCGEPLTTLTKSEEAVIVHYSAGILGKFNKRQQDGMTAVAVKEEKAAEDEPVSTEEPQDKKEQENRDKQKKEENTPEASESEVSEKVSLTQAIGIPGVEITYTGYEVRTDYIESDVLSMVSKEGNTYFVMKFTITNTGSGEAACDLIGKKPIFTLSLGGALAHKNEVTLLSNDLSTYKENLAPGASAEAVLIFEVPLEETENITSIQADVQVNGVNGNVTM